MNFRQAVTEDSNTIWNILLGAKERRRKEGSLQWQDGYPNPETVANDIDKGFGYVLEDGNNNVIAYAALIPNYEPAYEDIEGQWLTNGDFLVVHRVAISEDFLGKGMATLVMKKIENYAVTHKIPSIKVDTNFDNAPMLKILEKLEYQYCGEVHFRGAARKAFEKVLIQKI